MIHGIERNPLFLCFMKCAKTELLFFATRLHQILLFRIGIALIKIRAGENLEAPKTFCLESQILKAITYWLKDLIVYASVSANYYYIFL